MSVRSRIAVHFHFDEESQNWAFHVREPRIVGGGQATLEEARQAAAGAVAYALEGQPAQDDQEGQIEYLDVCGRLTAPLAPAQLGEVTVRSFGPRTGAARGDDRPTYRSLVVPGGSSWRVMWVAG